MKLEMKRGWSKNCLLMIQFNSFFVCERESFLVIKDPTVLSSSLGFFLCSQLGNVEDNSNFFGTLPHELAWYLETGKIKKGFWNNKRGGELCCEHGGYDRTITQQTTTQNNSAVNYLRIAMKLAAVTKSNNIGWSTPFTNSLYHSCFTTPSNVLSSRGVLISSNGSSW